MKHLMTAVLACTVVFLWQATYPRLPRHEHPRLVVTARGAVYHQRQSVPAARTLNSSARVSARLAHAMPEEAPAAAEAKAAWEEEPRPGEGVTLVSQCSWDHTHSITAIARLWRGPMSVAIHAKGGRRWRESNSLGGDLASRLLAGMQPMRLEVVFLQASEVKVAGHTPGSYPINALRNAAMRRVRTSHLFICDIDFLPSDGLYAAALALVRGRHGGTGPIASVTDDAQSVMRRDRVAVVVPAFRLKGKCREPTMNVLAGPLRGRFQVKCFKHYLPRVPRHASALRKCLDVNWCEQFCPGCHTHSSTGYAAWWSQRSLLRRIACFDSMRYEPYVIAEKSQLPDFDEHYWGYGKNKIAFIAHLQHSGYEFHVLRAEFLIHVPHYPSLDKDEWVTAMKDAPKDIVDWHVRFLRGLKRAYPNYSLPRCEQFHEYL